MGMIKYGVGWVKVDICGGKEDKETELHIYVFYGSFPLFDH